jgi:hypothetical protein
MEVNGQLHAPATLPPVLIGYETGRIPDAVENRKNLFPLTIIEFLPSSSSVSVRSLLMLSYHLRIGLAIVLFLYTYFCPPHETTHSSDLIPRLFNRKYECFRNELYYHCLFNPLRKARVTVAKNNPIPWPSPHPLDGDWLARVVRNVYIICCDRQCYEHSDRKNSCSVHIGCLVTGTFPNASSSVLW